MQPVLQMLLRYFKQAGLLKMFLHLVWLCCVLIVCSVTYIVTFHFPAVYTAWQKSQSIEHFKQELSTTVAIDSHINQELQQLLTSIQADRTYVFRYHNGVPSVVGIPFMFHTNTHEIIRAGVSRVILFHQRIPSSLNGTSHSQFAKNLCVVYKNLDNTQNSWGHWYYETRQAKSMIRCPLFTTRGDILGFVGADWLIEPSNLLQQEIVIKNSSVNIARAFEKN
jgi:hypothetical protein